MDYAIPVVLLVLTIAIFFAIGRGSYASFGIPQVLLRILAAFPLLVSGIFLHFLRTATVASIIPPVLPARIFLALLTGVLEIAGALGLFVHRFRRTAAFWIASMMVAIIPANVYAAGKVIDGIQMPSVAIRTAMQVVYIIVVLLAGFGIPGRRQVRENN